MQWSKRKNLAVALAAAILFAASGSAAWPQGGRTIRMILPFPPGGPADIMARLLAQQVGAEGGPTMVVESHPGAASEIGTELVSQAAPRRRHLGHYFTFVCRAPAFPEAQLRSAEGFYATL